MVLDEMVKRCPVARAGSNIYEDMLDLGILFAIRSFRTVEGSSLSRPVRRLTNLTMEVLLDEPIPMRGYVVNDVYGRISGRWDHRFSAGAGTYLVAFATNRIRITGVGLYGERAQISLQAVSVSGEERGILINTEPDFALATILMGKSLYRKFVEASEREGYKKVARFMRRAVPEVIRSQKSIQGGRIHPYPSQTLTEVTRGCMGIDVSGVGDLYVVGDLHTTASVGGSNPPEFLAVGIEPNGFFNNPYVVKAFVSDAGFRRISHHYNVVWDCRVGRIHPPGSDGYRLFDTLLEFGIRSARRYVATLEAVRRVARW